MSLVPGEAKRRANRIPDGRSASPVGGDSGGWAYAACEGRGLEPASTTRDPHPPAHSWHERTARAITEVDPAGSRILEPRASHPGDRNTAMPSAISKARCRYQQQTGADRTRAEYQLSTTPEKRGTRQQAQGRSQTAEPQPPWRYRRRARTEMRSLRSEITRRRSRHEAGCTASKQSRTTDLCMVKRLTDAHERLCTEVFFLID